MKPVWPRGFNPTDFWLRANAKYHVSDDGCWLWDGAKTNGYPILYVDGVAYRVTRLIAHMELLLTEENRDGIEVCHRCNRKACINPDHLYLGTHTQNIRDAEQDGLVVHLRGAAHPRARLSEEDVSQIKGWLAWGLPAKTIAQHYEVHRSTINLIRKGKNWKHLGGVGATL